MPKVRPTPEELQRPPNPYDQRDGLHRQVETLKQRQHAERESIARGKGSSATLAAIREDIRRAEDDLGDIDAVIAIQERDAQEAREARERQERRELIDDLTGKLAKAKHDLVAEADPAFDAIEEAIRKYRSVLGEAVPPIVRLAYKVDSRLWEAVQSISGRAEERLQTVMQKRAGFVAKTQPVYDNTEKPRFSYAVGWIDRFIRMADGLKPREPGDDSIAEIPAGDDVDG